MARTLKIKSIKTHPNKVIIYAMIGTAIVIALDDLVAKHTTPTPHEFIAPFAIGLVLGFLADVAPDATRLLAVLVFLGVLFIRGPDFLGFLKVGEEMPAATGPGDGKGDTLASNGNGGGSKKKKHDPKPSSGGHPFPIK